MAKKPVVNLTRLQELMRKKGWGLGELAKYSGVNYDTVYSLAKGRRSNNSIDTLGRIARSLGVSVDYLLSQSDDASPPEGALPPPIRNLLDIAGQLPVTRQEELARIAALLVDLERERGQTEDTDETAASDQAGFEAALNVLERKKGARPDEMLEIIADAVPALRKLIGPPPPEDKSVNSG